MTGRSDEAIRRRLEALGEVDVPDVDPAFASRLETQLRSLDPGRHSGHGAAIRLAAVAAALVLVGVVVVASLRGDDSGLLLDATGDVRIEFADGSEATPSDVDRLADGTVVRVGPGGYARIGDVVLEPGDVAMIVGDEVEVVPDEPRPSAPTEPAPASTTTRSPTSTSAQPGRPGPPPTDAVPPATTRDRVVPTSVPVTRPTPPTTTPVDRPATSLPPADRLLLEATAGLGPRGEARVAWNTVPGATSYRVVLTSSADGEAPQPAYPADADRAMVVEVPASTSPRLEIAVVTPRGSVQVKVLVVALGTGGAELARSIPIAAGG